METAHILNFFQAVSVHAAPQELGNVVIDILPVTSFPEQGKGYGFAKLPEPFRGQNDIILPYSNLGVMSFSKNGNPSLRINLPEKRIPRRGEMVLVKYLEPHKGRANPLIWIRVEDLERFLLENERKIKMVEKITVKRSWSNVPSLKDGTRDVFVGSLAALKLDPTWSKAKTLQLDPKKSLGLGIQTTTIMRTFYEKRDGQWISIPDPR